MSLLDLFKKNGSSPAPSPISKFDERLPPLPPLPPPQATGVPPPPPRVSSLPPLPALPKAEPVKAPAPTAAPALPPMPKLEPKAEAKPTPPPMPTLAPMPVLPPMPAAKPMPPPMPAMPKAAPALPPMPKLDIPKISVEKAEVKQLPPIPTPHQPKHETSRLAKALEELTSADFDLEAPAIEAPVKVVPKTEVKALKQPAPRPFGPKQKFLSMSSFDAVYREIEQVQEDLLEVQANNERLGQLENQKKNSYDSIVNSFEHIQKQLLAIDEKLFKVN